MEIERYFEQIVDPTIADLEANPTSVRHAFLAAVVVFHAIDYLDANSYRKQFREDNADFALVDRIAHAFKHVRTRDPQIPALSAEEVIERPSALYGEAKSILDMSFWDWADLGGVTLNSDRQLDVLSAIKRATEFMRRQIGRKQDAAEKT